MIFEDHVACVISNGRIGVGCHVVEVFDDAFGGLLRWMCLLAGQGTECHYDGGVHCSCVVPVGAYDSLDCFFLCC